MAAWQGGARRPPPRQGASSAFGSSRTASASSSVVKLTLAANGNELRAKFAFNEALVAELKQLGGRWHDRRWHLPLAQHNAVTQAAARCGCLVEPLPMWILRGAQRDAWQAHGVLQEKSLSAEAAAARLGGRVKTAHMARLMEYQRNGVLCAVARGGRVLWGDEMGLGKTLQVQAQVRHGQRPAFSSTRGE